MDEPVARAVVSELIERGHQVVTVGPLNGDALEWGAVGRTVAELVSSAAADEGIVCCWTGTGVSIAANKVKGIRAALCTDAENARGARRWNDANVLALSLRLTSVSVMKEILEAWFGASYEGEEEASLQEIRKSENRD